MIAGLYYPIFLALGLVVSLEDWRQRRIRNLWIGAGLLVCAGGLLYLFMNSALGHHRIRFWVLGEYYLPWRYYPMVLAHLALSLAAGLILWRLAVWPAGDAKLFILFAFFLALINPNLRGFPYLLFLVLLINIFVPAGLFMACEATARFLLGVGAMRTEDRRKSSKAALDRISKRLVDAWPRRGQYLVLGFNLVVLFFALRLAERRFQAFFLGPFGQLGLFFAMAVSWKWLVLLLCDPAVGYAALAVFVGAGAAAPFLGFEVGPLLSEGCRMAASFWMLLFIARVALHWIIERQSRRELDAGGLKAGDILSDETWTRLMEEKSFGEKLGPRYSDGLTREEAENVKVWLQSPRPAPENASAPAEGFTVYHSIPFAVWIFLGSILTLANRGTAVALLAPYFWKAYEALKPAAPWGSS